MAVKFYLPDGTVTDLIGITIPLFFGRTPDEVLEGLKMLKPDPATGKPDEKKSCNTWPPGHGLLTHSR